MKSSLNGQPGRGTASSAADGNPLLINPDVSNSSSSTTSHSYSNYLPPILSSSSPPTSALAPAPASTSASSLAPVGSSESLHNGHPHAVPDMSSNRYPYRQEYQQEHPTEPQQGYAQGYQSHHDDYAPLPPPRYPSSTTLNPGALLPVPSSYGSSPANDSHRTSPNSLALPSMRTVEPIAPLASQNLGSTHGSGIPSTGLPLYPGHSPSSVLSSNYGLSPEALARYALPPDPRVLRQPKKEIKRRTKTGCLTCRKRRIKCDETHPSCNNCKKSKRECLGYDPIFRPQAGGSPSSSQANLQQPPRSSSALSNDSSHTLSTPTSFSDSHPSLGPSGPGPPELPSQSSYGSHTAGLSSNYTSAPHPGPGDYMTGSSSSYSVHSHRDHHSPSPTSPPIWSTDPNEGSSAGPHLDPQRSLPPLEYLRGSTFSGHQDTSRASTMRVDELINTWGPPPTAPESVKSEDTYQEVVKVYHEMYAPGLHTFFESSWFYFTENGKMSFPRHGALVGQMALFLKVLEGVKVSDHNQMAQSGVLELRLVWDLCKIAASAAPAAMDNRTRTTLPPESDPIEVKNRFCVVDALLGGEYLPEIPLAAPSADPNPHRTREFGFWHALAEFVQAHQDKDEATAEREREDALSRLRWLLDGRENRDVLYSIATLRHYAHRYDMTQAMLDRYHLPEEDPKNKAVVAAKFVSAQANVTGGTTNVVRRLCDVASKLWVSPGENARRG